VHDIKKVGESINATPTFYFYDKKNK